MSANEPARNWWLIELHCLCAFGLGLAVLVWPNLTWVTLVSIFSIYLLVDGLLVVITSLTCSPDDRLRWRSLIEGLVGISAGGLAVLSPGLTALTRLYLLLIWAILTGPMEIVSAVWLRKNSANEGRLAWSSLLSLVLGGGVVIWSETHTLTLVWPMVSYVLAFGLMLLGLGLRLWNKQWSVHLLTVPSSRVEVERYSDQRHWE